MYLILYSKFKIVMGNSSSLNTLVAAVVVLVNVDASVNNIQDLWE